MNFIRVGNRSINLDNVAYIEWEQKCSKDVPDPEVLRHIMYFITPGGSDQEFSSKVLWFDTQSKEGQQLEIYFRTCVENNIEEEMR